MVKTNDKISYLFRSANYDKLKEYYENKQIAFTCAANWISYFKDNPSIGDFREGAFACIKEQENAEKLVSVFDDFRKDILCIKNHNHILSYIPILTVPCLCFYSISNNVNDFKQDKLYSFDLQKYSQELSDKNTGILLIHNVEKFIIDLKKQVRLLIKKGSPKIRTNEQKTFFAAKNIEYIDLTNNEYLSFSCDENLLFRKDISYKWQSEFRVVLPKFNFSKPFSFNNYNEQLVISLPNIQEYAFVFSLEEFDSLFVKKHLQKIELSMLKR